MFVLKLSEHAILPNRATSKSVGYDLYSAYETTIAANSKGLIATDISIKIPDGHYARIAARSSVGWKYHSSVGCGVIDPDYFPGNIKVVIFNHSNQDIKFEKHSRIAQLILEKCSTPDVIEIFDNQTDSDRVGGFGSTGK